MRQVVVESFNGVEGIRVAEAPEPHAQRGEVRVRVCAAGLNPVDLRIAEGGVIAERFGAVPPYVNGNDFAGVIDEIGEGVEGWAIGDRVYGGARCRAQSELLVLSTSDLMRTPDGLGDIEAAALDIAARTAWAGVEALRLQPGETIVISAAAGGCGLLACQFAMRAGARVIGLASPRNHDLLGDLGVIALDYRQDLVPAVAAVAPEGVSAFFDAHSADYLALAQQLGVPVTRINSVADRAAAESMGAISIGRAATSPSALEPLGRMAAAGDLRVVIDRVLPFEKAREAYAYLARGHARGKVVLDFS